MQLTSSLRATKITVALRQILAIRKALFPGESIVHLVADEAAPRLLPPLSARSHPPFTEDVDRLATIPLRAED